MTQIWANAAVSVNLDNYMLLSFLGRNFWEDETIAHKPHARSHDSGGLTGITIPCLGGKRCLGTRVDGSYETSMPHYSLTRPKLPQHK